MYELLLTLQNVILVLVMYIMLMILHYNIRELSIITSLGMFLIGFVVLTSEWNFIIGMLMTVIGALTMFDGD